MPPNDTAIAVLTQKVDNLLQDAGERREQMTELVRAVNKLAVIEERQTADRGALERAFNAITQSRSDWLTAAAQSKDEWTKSCAALDVRLKKLEESDPLNKLSSGFVMKALWIVVAGFLGATVSGAFKSNNPPAMIQVAPSAPVAPAQTNSQPLNP